MEQVVWQDACSPFLIEWQLHLLFSSTVQNSDLHVIVKGFQWVLHRIHADSVFSL